MIEGDDAIITVEMMLLSWLTTSLGQDSAGRKDDDCRSGDTLSRADKPELVKALSNLC